MYFGGEIYDVESSKILSDFGVERVLDERIKETMVEE